MRASAFQRDMDPISEDHVERLLDHALEETFPASDPVAVSSAAQALTEAAMGTVPSAQVGRIGSG